MKSLKKIFSIMLIVLTLTACMITPAHAATRAKFNSGSYCEVKISQSLINKKGKQNATVKLNTHPLYGSYNSGGKVSVTMRDQYGRHIWSGVVKGGTTLKLGDDHSVYRIYMTPYQQPSVGNIFQRSIIDGNNFENAGKCAYWSITNPSNCAIR